MSTEATLKYPEISSEETPKNNNYLEKKPVKKTNYWKEFEPAYKIDTILDKTEDTDSIKEKAIITELISDSDEETRNLDKTTKQINSKYTIPPENYLKKQENKIFEELYYNDFNFPELQKVLLKNLNDTGAFSDFNSNIQYVNGVHTFSKNNLQNIFSSKYISEKNKTKFGNSIISILKKNMLKGHLIDGYSKKDVQKQKKALKKEFFNNPIYIEQKLEKLGLSNLEKYFPEKKFKYTLNDKINRFKDKIENSVFKYFF